MKPIFHHDNKLPRLHSFLFTNKVYFFSKNTRSYLVIGFPLYCKRMIEGIILHCTGPVNSGKTWTQYADIKMDVKFNLLIMWIKTSHSTLWTSVVTVLEYHSVLVKMQ